MARWPDGYIARQLDGQTGREIAGLLDSWMDRQTGRDNHTHAHMQTHTHTHTCTHAHMHTCTHAHTHTHTHSCEYLYRCIGHAEICSILAVRPLDVDIVF